MKQRIFFLLVIFLSVSFVNTHLFAQASGDFVATTSGDYNTASNWSISNGVGGYSSVASTAPTSTDNVWIPVGINMTNTSAAAYAKNLVIGGSLIAGSSTSSTQDVLAYGNLTILSTGVLQSTSANAGYVGKLKVGTSLQYGPCTLQIDGQLGSSSGTVGAGSGFRLSFEAGGTTTVQGSGKFNLSQIKSGEGNARNQDIIIDMDINLMNTASNGKTLTLENGNAITGIKTLTINEGRIVNFSTNSVNSALGGQVNFTAESAYTGGDMTFNVLGTLNTGTGGGLWLMTTSSTANTASQNQKITLRVGPNGKLFIGPKIKTGVTQSTQAIVFDFQEGSIVEFNGSTAPSFLGSTSSVGSVQSYMDSFSNLNINNSGGVTLPVSTTVSGALTLTSGSLATGAKSLILGGTISGTGTINTVGGTLNFAGDSEQILDGANVESGVIDNLVINSDSKLTTTGTVSATNLTINSDINSTGTLKGTLTSSNATVNKSFQQAGELRTWYITAPVASATPIGMSTIQSYDESTYSWSSATSTMLSKVGYQVVPTSAATDFSATGVLNAGNQTIALTSRTGTDNMAGFNLIGNPYPSYLNWSLVTGNTLNTNSLRSAALWYKMKTGDVYKYSTVNGDGISSPNGISNYIPPMQAFWVRAVEGGSNLALTEDMCAHASVSPTLAFPLLRLQVDNGTNSDEAVIYFSDNADNTMDIYDAPKMSNENAAIPEIYTTLNSEHFVINAMNAIPLDASAIDLGFSPGSGTAFSIRANEISNFPTDVRIILKDNVTFTETDLTDGSAVYQFDYESITSDRFSIFFRSSGVTTDINDSKDNKVQVYWVNNKIQVKINDEKLKGSDVVVYNSLGQQVASQKITETTMNLAFNYNPDVYLVRVDNVIKKIIVK